MSSYNPTDEFTYVFDNKNKFEDGRTIYNFCAGPCVLPRAVLEVA